jgi:MFS family permease
MMLGLFAFTAALQLVNNAFSRIVIPTAMTVFFSSHTAASRATLLSAGALSVVLILQPVVGIWADQLGARLTLQRGEESTYVPAALGHHPATPALPQARLTLFGAVVVAGALCAMGMSFPAHPGLWMAAFVLMTVGMVLSGTAYEAVKATLVPPDKRAAGGAVQGIYETIGSSAGYLLATYGLPIAQGRGSDSQAARTGSYFFFACAGIVAVFAAVSSAAAVRVRLPLANARTAVTWVGLCLPSPPSWMKWRGRRSVDATSHTSGGHDIGQEQKTLLADTNGSVQPHLLSPPPPAPAAAPAGCWAGWTRLGKALHDPDLRMLVLSRVAYAAGLSVTQLHLFFLMDVVGAQDTTEAAKWLTWGSFVDSGMIVVAGKAVVALSTMYGRKQFVYASTALYIAAFVALPWVHRRGVAAFLAGPSVLFGLAHGIQKSVDFAILVDVIDRDPRSVGTYAGVWATAATLGSTVGSYIFGPLLDAFPNNEHSRIGFLVSYSVVASAMMLLSAVAVWAIHDQRLRPCTDSS